MRRGGVLRRHLVRDLLSRALDRNKKKLPILVVYDSDLTGKNIREYFQGKSQLIYVSLGYSCPMNRLYQEILFQLAPHENPQQFKNHKRGVVEVCEKIRQSEKKIIVIDNCQHLVIMRLFYLLGLLFELDGLVQFIFIIEGRYYARWNQTSGINKLRVEFFISHFKKKILLN